MQRASADGTIMRAGPRAVIGVLPAAGAGTRLAPFRYPKELLPVLYENAGSGVPRPRIVAEFALEALRAGGASRCVVVIAPWKTEIMSYLGDGTSLGLNLAYVFQETARGLPHALDLAYPWTRDATVVFAMPDTIVRPASCVASVRQLLERTDAHVALGLFPSSEAQRLGPVALEGDAVVAIYDKVANPPVNTVWGVAAWGPEFSEFLRTELAARRDRTTELVLGQVFDAARRAGLHIKGTVFTDGAFADIGTPEGIQRCLELGRRGPE